jgi:hypothetical protein
MKSKLTLWIFWISGVLQLNAQDILNQVVWMDEFKGNMSWLSNSMIDTDEDGNIMFGVTTHGFAEHFIAWRGDTLVKQDLVAGNRVIFLAKLDPDGDVLWHLLLDGTDNLLLQEMKIDHFGNIILFVESSAPFEAFQQTFNSGYTLLKIDTDGQFLWSQYFKNAEQHLFATNHLMSIACNDDIIVSGSIGQVVYDSVMVEIIGYDTLFTYLLKHDTLHLDGQVFPGDTNNIFVARLDPDGNLKWLQKFVHNGGFDIFAIDGSTPYGIALLGSYRHEDWPVFNTVLSVDTTGYFHKQNMFVMILDSEGQVQWVRKYFNNANPNHIAYDHDGQLLVIGSFHGMTYFDTDTIINTDQAGDLLLFKTDQTGHYVWGINAGGQGTNFDGVLATNSQGDIYLTGGLSNLIGAILNKYDADGQELWSINPQPVSSRVGEDLVMDRFGNLILCGFFSGELTIGSHTLQHTGPYINAIVKFDAENSAETPSPCETVSTVNPTNAAETRIDVYPNPANDELIIDASHGDEVLQISIYDLHGRILMTRSPSANNPINMEISGFPEGVYAVRMTSRQAQTAKTFVILR